MDNTNYLFGDAIGNGKVIAGLPNPALTWETSREYNFGLDFAILNNRVRLGVEVYNKETEGSILNRQLLDITGFDDAVGNFGSVRNQGVEVTLNTVNIRTDDFSWQTSINFAKNTNEILELDGDLDEIPYGRHGVLKLGEAVDAIYSYENEGIWQLDETSAAAVYNSVPGEYKFVDQNNDDLINEEDKVVLGSISPEWTAGMTNTFTYKNLDLSVQVYTRQGVFGHSEFYQHFAPFQGDRGVFNKVDLDYWTPNNPDAKYPAPDYGNPGEYFYEELDFVRIGNIGMGYNFPQDLVDRLRMSNLRMSLDVQNPFTFTDYEGPDPETGLQNSYNMTYAVKTFLLGLKLSF